MADDDRWQGDLDTWWAGLHQPAGPAAGGAMTALCDPGGRLKVDDMALLVRELERFGHARRCRMLAYLTDLFGPSYNAEKETDD